MKNTISLAVACWGSYWSRFGAEFLASLEEMDPKFSEVVLVAQGIDVPPWIRLVRPQSDVRQWDWFNEAVDVCTSKWIMVGAIDDPMLPDGLADFKFRGDFIATSCMQNGTLESASRESWERLMDVRETAIWTSALFKRDVFLKHPWRQVVYPDWMQWLELKHVGAKITFDSKPRFIHRRHDGAHTMFPSHIGDRQIREMKRMLANGQVTPGNHWPPQGTGYDVERPSTARELFAEMRRRRTMQKSG